MYYVLYSVPIVAWIGVLAVVGWLLHRLRVSRQVQHEYQQIQRANVRLTLHLDHLMRHFHIHGNDVPYVAQSESKTAQILCWHCRAQQGQSHDPKCPYAYVQEHFVFTANGRPTLRG